MQLKAAIWKCLLAAAGLGLASGLSGCLMVGWSSTGGGFIWPGGLGLVFVVLLVTWILRRR